MPINQRSRWRRGRSWPPWRYIAEACARHGALLAVNDRADIALAAGADVLHLGQDDLPVPIARRILGDTPIIGRSTHANTEATASTTEPGWTSNT